MVTIPLLVLFLFTTAIIQTQLTLAKVPPENQFKYVNEGEFGPYITEYDASYRAILIFEAPFQLAWYNTTPGQFYLGLRMGLRRSESLFRWVWAANRGRPVGENAIFTFGEDGNLVLAESDGRVVCATDTANKGATGVKLLPTGNLVIYDNQGKFLWQSFDYPTDTILVGQSLYVGGPMKIVSRRSATDNSDGIYSFVLEPKALNLYVANSPNPLLYSGDSYSVFGSIIQKATFMASPTGEGTATVLSITINDGAGTTFIVTRPKYNATLSFLRIAVDGNLEVYTYYDPVDYRAWERTFAFFSDDLGTLPGCSLPEKCGALGLCHKEMCVACPTSRGLLGWSESCKPPTVGVMCKNGWGVGYYKVVGVEQFIAKLNKGLGKVRLEECKSRCTADCKCLGLFYYEESSECWLAPVLGSLATSTNASHVAYIKTYGYL